MTYLEHLLTGSRNLFTFKCELNVQKIIEIINSERNRLHKRYS